MSSATIRYFAILIVAVIIFFTCFQYAVQFAEAATCPNITVRLALGSNSAQAWAAWREIEIYGQ